MLFKRNKKDKSFEELIRKIEENTKKTCSVNDSLFGVTTDFISATNSMLKMVK